MVRCVWKIQWVHVSGISVIHKIVHMSKSKSCWGLASCIIWSGNCLLYSDYSEKKNVDESFTCFDIWTGNCPFHQYEHLQYKIVQISWCVYSIRCPWKKMCQRFMSAALRRRRAMRQMRWEHHHCGQCNVVVLNPALHGKHNFFLLLSTISSYVRCVLWARTCLLDVDWLMKADVMNQVSEYGEVKNLQCCWCQGPESSDLVYIHSLVAWALWMWAILFHVCYPWIKKKKKEI